jgi:hypothetical protein
MAQTATGAAPAKDIGWTFDPAPRPGAAPGTSARVVFSDRTTVELRYDPASTRYGVFEAGAGLAGASPANVVVMQVPVVASKYQDVTGAVTPFTGTLGFRSGRGAPRRHPGHGHLAAALRGRRHAPGRPGGRADRPQARPHVGPAAAGRPAQHHQLTTRPARAR